MKKLFTLLMALLLVITLGACSSGGNKTFEGEAEGFGGPVKVKVTLDGEKITNIDVTADKETPTVGGAAIPLLVEQVLANQSTQLDSISGASVTSTAFF